MLTLNEKDQKKWLSMRLINNIKFICERNNISTTELEEKVECSRGYLAKMFNENDFNPSFNILIRISNALNCSLDLLTRIDLPNISEEDNNVVELLDKLCFETINKKYNWDNLELDISGNVDLTRMTLEEKFQYEMLEYKQEYIDDDNFDKVICTKKEFDGENQILLYRSSSVENGNRYFGNIRKCYIPQESITFFLIEGKTPTDIKGKTAYELYICDEKETIYPLCSSGYNNKRSIFNVYLENLSFSISENYSKVTEKSSQYDLVKRFLKTDFVGKSKEVKADVAITTEVFVVKEDSNLKSTKLKSFVFNDEKFDYVKASWNTLIHQLASILYKLSPEQMKNLARLNWKFKTKKAKRPAITNYLQNAEDNRLYYELPEANTKIYICDNFDANDIKDFAYALIKEFGFDDDSLTIEAIK